MTAKNRSSHSVKNIIFSIMLYLFDIFFKFVVRTVFIRVLAIELLGLNGLYANILNVLSLTELGLGTALTFSMYKPIAENDLEKTRKLYHFFKKVYSIVILIILSISLILLPFLKHFMTGEVPANVNIYAAYLIYIINTCVSYLNAHKKSLLLAVQRNDINSKIEILKTLALNVGQIVVLLCFKNYYVYLIMMPISTFIEHVLTSAVVKKNYKTYTQKVADGKLDSATKKEIKTNTFALIFHKIGGTVVSSTDNILISSIIGLSVLGIYTNYALITGAIALFLNTLLNALKGSIGNLIAKEEKDTIYQNFNRLNFVYFCLVCFCTTCLLCLFQPFMTMWVGEEFKFSISTVVLLVVSFYFTTSRSMLYSFKECAGLLKQDQFRPIVEVIINLGLSILLGVKIGVNGVIIGTIVSQILGPIITEPYVVYKNLFHQPVWKFYVKYAVCTLITATIAGATFWLCQLIPFGGLWWFVVRALVTFVVTVGLILISTFYTKDFKRTITWAKQVIKNFKEKK